MEINVKTVEQVIMPHDLINPKSAITGNVPTVKETKHWFLPLDKHEDFLRKWILEGHKKDWKPNVYGQVKSLGWKMVYDQERSLEI